LRLKQNLDFHSDKFLETYAVYGLDPETGFPIVSLNMAGNPERRCPFVRDDGCGVYPDRPMACRLFPLGRASGMSPDGRSSEEFFFTLKVTGCMGTEQGNVQSVREWRDDQGLLPYTEMNDRMLGLVFHPRRDCQRPLSEPQLQKIMVACYNLDVFREFVFEAGFADRWGIDSATCSKIRTDDTALLKLGFRYLKQTLYD
jgi:Fe-S-cluster containining protein